MFLFLGGFFVLFLMENVKVMESMISPRKSLSQVEFKPKHAALSCRFKCVTFCWTPGANGLRLIFVYYKF